MHNLKRWKELMKTDRIRNRIVASALVAVLGIGCVPAVYASAISDAQNKKEQAQEDLEAQNAMINNIQGQKDDLQTEINALDAELVNIITNMTILEEEVDAKEVQLEELGAELEQAQEDEKSQYENMKKRIRYMYENENTSMLEIILGAKDFGDFLNRVEYASQVYGHDRDLLADYQATVQTVADLKVQVEGEKAELEQMHAEYEEQEKVFQAQLDEKRSTMDNFEVQLADAKQLAAEYQQIIAQQNELIRQEEERLRKEEEERKRREEEERKRKEEEEKKKKEEAAKNNGSSGSGSSSGNKQNTGSGGNKNPAYSTNVSGGSVVNYACQFIGNPYVFGGTSLTQGSDCSGFIMSVYANYGISLPHSSYALQGCGKEVSYNNAKPGDIICYAGHVAIYMGNGQIVHASSSAPYPVGGIKTGSATYRQILTVRRVL